ncbi:MAG: low molecular weight phosphotyrosine protein phosphatase [Proteobacteria bacterium]|nr:low molecular weight phosphotyrosine protein phosphatase [Pseudomonadota bacterium]
MRILFVCMGNICRSPTAEGVMGRLIDDAGLAHRISIDSAGTGGWHTGQLADPRTRAAAKRRGLDLIHRARQLAQDDLEHFDMIVVMDQANHTSAMRLVGQRTTPVVRMLRSFDATAPEGAEVPDPYNGGPEGFDEVLDQCERACRGLLAHVRTIHTDLR